MTDDMEVRLVKRLIRQHQDRCPLHGMAAVQGPSPVLRYKCPRRTCGLCWSDAETEEARRVLRKVRKALDAAGIW